MLERFAHVAGLVLRAATAAVLRVRRPRPIHAHGLVLEGDIRWLSPRVRSGIAWIDRDAPSREPVVGRVSRSVGLPPRLPDVIGLALRVPAETGPADLELATTGRGSFGRLLLLPRLTASGARFGTLLPYRSGAGPVQVSARSDPRRRLPAALPDLQAEVAAEPWVLQLSFAIGAGPWHPFAVVTLGARGNRDDGALRFDAVRHPLPGAGTYEWVRRLRQPSYRRAQAEPSEASTTTALR